MAKYQVEKVENGKLYILRILSKQKTKRKQYRNISTELYHTGVIVFFLKMILLQMLYKSI